MDTNLAKIARRNSILVAILIVIAMMVLVGLLAALVPSRSLKTFFAIIAITLAVALPIHQKRFSLYSLYLVLSGILFLVSGAVDYAYHTVVSPLPVLQQSEFSMIMRPRQVSGGLWHVGIGILYMLFSFAAFQSKETFLKPKSPWSKFVLLTMAVVGVLYSILGITSIVEGLRKL